MLNMEEPIMDRCVECMEKFKFVAACKHHYHARDIADRLKKENVNTSIKTINDDLFLVVLV